MMGSLDMSLWLCRGSADRDPPNLCRAQGDPHGPHLDFSHKINPLPQLFPTQHFVIAQKMADERSPLLQNEQEDGAQTLDSDYLAINEHEQADPAAINGSTDTEQQQTAVAPQSSVVTLVRLFS